MYSLEQTPESWLSELEISKVGARGDLVCLFSTIQSAKDLLKLLDKFLETPNASSYIDKAACLSMKMCAAEIRSALKSMRNALTFIPYIPEEIYKPDEEE